MTNFEVKKEIIDNYVYRFYGDIDYHKEMVSYAQMAKKFMNKPFRSPLDIVGNYEWHEQFPYEKHLFTEEQQSNRKNKVIDFGCGPGRMVARARKLFDEVDGVDISEYAIDYAREHFPGSKFYVSSGIDVGDVPENTYDIVFSTIAMQHIPCRTIRKNLWRGMFNILKPGGNVSVQVAYHPTRQAGVWSPDTEHASYESDFWNAKATNGHADMVINQQTLPLLLEDLSEIFRFVDYELVNVDKLYNNLNGRYHAPYWAESWLFCRGIK